jgi:hypothetical protein
LSLFGGRFYSVQLNRINNTNQNADKILSGTNNYPLQTNIQPGGWVRCQIGGGGLTTGTTVGSFQFIVGGTAYTAAQAITNNYIEPLILTGTQASSGTYYFPNFHNILVGNTSSGDYPTGEIFFKPKVVITGFRFYASKSHNTQYDGFRVYQYDDGLDFSLTELIE